VQHWDLRSLPVESHEPVVLSSTRGESRTVVLQLPGGEALRDHQVHERAHVVVIDGEVEIDQGGQTISGGPGLMAVFDPGERHEVRARSDARLLLVLAPWPGEGHPGARDA
jgi:quercetin dioxygenase-like cupin family protein